MVSNHFIGTTFALQQMEKWMLPEAYIFIDEIRKTSTGKFDKKALRADYQHVDWEECVA